MFYLSIEIDLPPSTISFNNVSHLDLSEGYVLRTNAKLTQYCDTLVEKVDKRA